MSGLSPRVIRVWFQNKRCKDKKNQIKMEMQQERVSEMIVGLRIFTTNNLKDTQFQDRHKQSYEHGIKLVAHSPIDSAALLNSQAMDITQYQPPWQTLNNFAMSANFDSEQFNSNHPEFIRLNQQVCRLTTIIYIHMYNTHNRK